jgi:hypothetical protein
LLFIEVRRKFIPPGNSRNNVVRDAIRRATETILHIRHACDC